jgi:hypothetical protein
VPLGAARAVPHLAALGRDDDRLGGAALGPGDEHLLPGLQVAQVGLATGAGHDPGAVVDRDRHLVAVVLAQHDRAVVDGDDLAAVEPVHLGLALALHVELGVGQVPGHRPAERAGRGRRHPFAAPLALLAGPAAVGAALGDCDAAHGERRDHRERPRGAGVFANRTEHLWTSWSSG